VLCESTLKSNGKRAPCCTMPCMPHQQGLAQQCGKVHIGSSGESQVRKVMGVRPPLPTMCMSLLLIVHVLAARCAAMHTDAA
jgi:hypothetical protein